MSQASVRDQNCEMNMVRPICSILCSLVLLLVGMMASGCDVGLGPHARVDVPVDGSEPSEGSEESDPGEDDPTEGDPSDGADDLAGSCLPQATLTCGSVITADSRDDYAHSNIDSYDCSGWDASGPEVTFSVEVPYDGLFTATLLGVGAGADLDVYVIEAEGSGCMSEACVAYGDTEATWSASEQGEYYIVVDGFLGDAAPFTLQLLCDEEGDLAPPDPRPDPEPEPEPEPEPDPEDSCDVTEALGCQSSVSADTSAAGVASAIDAYSCVGWDASGPELIYSFHADSDGTVTASLSSIQSGEDLDVYILSGDEANCSPEDCLAYGNTTASFEATAGENYFIVVDGFYGAAGTFDLELVCEAPLVGSDADALATCSTPIEGDTTTATDELDDYSCVGWDASGPELVYSFTAATTGEITAHFQELASGQDLDIYVLSDELVGLDPGACVTYGNYSASWTANEGESYYIVVDGFLGDAGTFTLSLACPVAAVGESYCLDWSTVNFTAPSSLSQVLASFNLDLEEHSLLLSATEIDEAAGSISMSAGTAQAGSCAQDTTVTTVDLTAAGAGTWNAGEFEVGPTDMDLTLGGDVFPVHGLVLSGEYSSASGTIVDLEMSGELEVTSLPWTACYFSLPCHLCPDGAGACVTLGSDSGVLIDSGAGALISVP
ncbi:MAG: hypothetical protein VX498_09150 [Myxococcota bacterium]|nr:hypothetical protein [Myxococcota bacterium]